MKQGASKFWFNRVTDLSNPPHTGVSFLAGISVVDGPVRIAAADQSDSQTYRCLRCSQPVDPGRYSSNSLEHYGKLARAVESTIECDLGQCTVLVFHHLLSPIDTVREQIAVRR
jgi:hypothetical protein